MLRFKVLKCDFISKDNNMCNICVMPCKKEGDSKYQKKTEQPQIKRCKIKAAHKRIEYKRWAQSFDKIKTSKSPTMINFFARIEIC